MKLWDKIIAASSLVVPATVALGIRIWGKGYYCSESIDPPSGSGMSICTKYAANGFVSDIIEHNFSITIPTLLFSLACWGYLGGKYYLAKRALSKKQVIPNNSYYPQQNIETQVEQYQYQEPQSQDYQNQNISNTYTQGTQNSYLQSTDLEDKIAQLKSDIQELESN